MKMTFVDAVRFLHLKPLFFKNSSFSLVPIPPTAGSIFHETVQRNPDATSSAPEDALNNFSIHQANKT